jgi:hypothetical protein
VESHWISSAPAALAYLAPPARALERIDWNFPRAGNEQDSVHAAHWFPGNSIPQIPSALIQTLSHPGDVILDPFGGSGTTALEALKLGRRILISDRLSACVMISHGKISLQTTPISRNVKSELLARLTWEHQCRSDAPGTNNEGTHPSLSEWYSPRTLAELRYLWSLIEEQKVPTIRRILTLLFSDVLFTCASPGAARTSSGKRRRHHWGWVADNVRPQKLLEHRAVRAFEHRLLALPDPPVRSRARDVIISQQDARRLGIDSDAVDLVVTSPPYFSVIDYTRANRLLYAWMGWPFDKERSEEIGARFKRGRKQAVENYLVEMLECWREIHRVLRRNAYCAVVIGESRHFPGTADQTLSGLATLMSPVWGPVVRNPSRRRLSERDAREFVEYVYVFQKL